MNSPSRDTDGLAQLSGLDESQPCPGSTVLANTGENSDVRSVGMGSDGRRDEFTSIRNLWGFFLHLSGADGSFAGGLAIKPIDWLE